YGLRSLARRTFSNRSVSVDLARQGPRPQGNGFRFACSSGPVMLALVPWVLDEGRAGFLADVRDPKNSADSLLICIEETESRQKRQRDGRSTYFLQIPWQNITKKYMRKSCHPIRSCRKIKIQYGAMREIFRFSGTRRP